LYGTAFFSQKELDAYITQLEEAKKRDHRVLGRQLKLFTISQVAGQGMILWMPKGATVRSLLEGFIREELLKRSYTPVYTPHIGNLNLYRTSGHFPYYADAQFPPMYMSPLAGMIDTWVAQTEKGTCSADEAAAYRALVEKIAAGTIDPGANDLPRYPLGQMRSDAKALLVKLAAVKDVPAQLAVLQEFMTEQEGYLLKPMNCPHHIQIYKAAPKSYRDLPIKLAEFGTVYRFEQSGELGGMTRVRGFTQDDAHLFVTPEQVDSEIRTEIELVLFILRTLNLTVYRVRVSVRDPQSSKFTGDPAQWDVAEATLKNIVESTPGLNWSIGVGEGAFYGPKIDFIVKDCIGREWQLGTIQLDYVLPKRFELEYAAGDNTLKLPVMIHRAPFGSLERFTGILIENFAGAFPLWLAPEQIRVLTISEKSQEYGQKLETSLKTAGLRTSGDYRAEKIGSKIREAQLEKIPYMAIVGEKDLQNGTVSLRHRTQGELGAIPQADLLPKLLEEIRTKTIV
ncbi:MAG: threonine--tRNA ligase, partial [Gemmataceae bacterium]